MGKISALKNTNQQIWLEFLSYFPLNFKCHPEDEMCPSQFYRTFILAEFWVFRQKLENATKVLEWGIDIKGFDKLARVLTKVASVDLSKVFKGEC
jgi:hypothetical protein